MSNPGIHEIHILQDILALKVWTSTQAKTLLIKYTLRWLRGRNLETKDLQNSDILI